jgi:hypothetical protein
MEWGDTLFILAIFVIAFPNVNLSFYLDCLLRLIKKSEKVENDSRRIVRTISRTRAKDASSKGILQ